MLRNLSGTAQRLMSMQTCDSRMLRPIAMVSHRINSPASVTHSRATPLPWISALRTTTAGALTLLLSLMSGNPAHALSESSKSAQPVTLISRLAKVPTAPTPIYKNSLVINVTGYRSGSPFIGVKGPKQNAASLSTFFRTLRKSATLTSLTPGRYTITAQPVMLSDGRYIPSAASGTVTMKASGTVKYTITYRKESGSNSGGGGTGGGGSDTKVTAVTGLKVEPVVGKLSVSWDAVFGASGITYTVTATAVGESSPSGTCTATRTTANCSGLLDSKSYVVSVVSKSAAGATATATATAVTPLKPNQMYVNGVVLGPGINADGKNLAGARLLNASLRGTSLVNADLTGADLTGADLTGAILTGVHLKSATLKNVKSGNISTVPASLPEKWTIVGGYLVGPGANLSGATFGTGSSFTDVSLTGALISGASFKGAKFTRVDFTGATARNVDFTNADLRDVTSDCLVGLTLDGGNFTNARLDGLNLTSASMKTGKFTGASLVGANLTLTVLTSTTFSGADLTNAVASKADFTNADLKLATLAGANFTNAILTSVSSGSVIGEPSKLPTGWGVRGGYVIGQAASLSAAKLVGVDLSGLDLRAAVLSSANLSGALLVGANLSGTTLTSANLTGANLTTATLVGANLSNVSMTGATVTDTDFSSAILTSLVATGLTGTPKNIPSGWKYDATKQSIVKVV